MIRLLLFASACLTGCGTINALKSASGHGRYKDMDHKEVGRTMGDPQNHNYSLIVRDITNKGVEFAVQQENICPVRVDHRANQRAQRTGSAMLKLTGKPDKDIFLGTAIDLAVGASVVGLSSFGAHYNPNASPQSYRKSQSVLWGLTFAVVGIDLGAHAYSVKRRTKVRTWHTTETKVCSKHVPVLTTAKMDLIVEGKKWPAPSPKDAAKGRYMVPAGTLGAVLMARAKVEHTGAISWTVNVEQKEIQGQLRGKGTFTETVGSGMVMRYARDWRCAAVSGTGGDALVGSWDLTQQAALLNQLDVVKCGSKAIVKKRICDASKLEASKGRTRPRRTPNEVKIFIDTCGDRALWTKAVDGDIKADLDAGQLARARYNISLYKAMYGKKWEADWNKKAEALVSKQMGVMLGKKNEEGVTSASNFLVTEKPYLSERTLGKLRGSLQSRSKAVVGTQISRENFSAARALITRLTPGAGESWAKGQERLVVSAIKKREKRLAAAKKWCRDNRTRITEKVYPYRQCMRIIGQGPDMYRRRKTDKDLYVARMYEGSNSCVAKLGLDSTMERFARDCDCSDVSRLTFEDSSGWDHTPCDDLKEEVEESQRLEDRRTNADKAGRACIDQEQRLASRHWAWRQCMVDYEWTSKMQQYRRSNSDLYDEKMAKKAKSCLDRLGISSTMKRLADKCSCRDLDGYKYEDMDNNDHNPCEDYARD